ncbi:MAG: imelysin family protein [Methylacidiphilales bacterium]|nr:imelysin family protein [Candidatus Methylacidiphilales bacterium]
MNKRKILLSMIIVSITTCICAFMAKADTVSKNYVFFVEKQYSTVLTALGKLESSLQALLNKPSELTLHEARKNWIEVRALYAQTEVFRFYDGPIEQYETRINSWPIRYQFIESDSYNAVTGSQIIKGFLSNNSFDLTNEKIIIINQLEDTKYVSLGWHAIEYMVWGVRSENENAGNRSASYFIENSEQIRKRLYLKILIEQLRNDLESVHLQWVLDTRQGSNRFANSFIKLSKQESLTKIITGAHSLVGLEILQERFLAPIDSGDPNEQQSCFSGTTTNDHINNIIGVKKLWEEVLYKEIVDKNKVLASHISNAIVRSETKARALPYYFKDVILAKEHSNDFKSAHEYEDSLKQLSNSLYELAKYYNVSTNVPKY